MAIGKDQSLTPGEFYPTSDQNVIYLCYLNNTRGFLLDLTVFSVLIGFFSFLFVQLAALLVVIVAWCFYIPYIVPKHYKFIQLNKHTLAFGSGSVPSLISSGFKTIYKLEKQRYRDIHYLKLDRWEKRKGEKADSFGRIEIKISEDKAIFHFLINSDDLARLAKILEEHRFHSKVQKKWSRGELMLVFPTSPRYVKS
ncbi:MAG: hypothetical protein JSV04_07440 [Candidatus Heimdallarchaeota archaeon]|nr:MAG: hypothetical protein JSV04_07440 [Candidatus Heimdallarchaeota archaeon]